MKVEVAWKGKMAFEGKGPSGHSTLLDAGIDSGGEDKAPRPTEALLSSLGGCTGIDVVLILKKMRMSLEEFNMVITSERAEEHPKKFTKINVHYNLKGQNLEIDKVKKALELTQEKYCSVSKSLNAEITYSFSINGEDY